MTDPSSARRASHPASPFVQVCDRCRWKKVKCDGHRPCGNCQRANLPCETRARLSKHSTPRSYVQYLEERIRQLENARESTWSPQASDSRNSPYGEARLRGSVSQSSGGDHPKKRSLPDWTVLRELGTHVIDEDGFTRYMGPSAGVGFSAKVLQEILDDDQPPDREYYSLFSLDDFSRSSSLADSDHLLWKVTPEQLPARADADKVIADFFTFTERVFPILHRPTFLKVVDDLYSLDTIDVEWFELLAQFYLVLSIGHCFNLKLSTQERTQNQIRGLQTGVRCFFTTIHMRRDGLTRLQTFTLHSYALVMLGQRSEAMRLSAMANTKALECGLHHDGHQFHGNPLETEMRRRVFWCVFMLHLFNSSIEGLPRALHEADITVAEPSEVDDDQLTTTEIMNSVPGRAKIHRFVSVCRLIRILSRSLDVLYSNNKRKHASTRIEQMNRLCCEHLLDQLDFSFEETPDDVPNVDTDDPAELAILASYANEQMLYYYIRWLIHRPGLSLPSNNVLFSSSLQVSTECASDLVKTADTYSRALPFLRANPAAHPCTIFIASLTPLYRTTLLKRNPMTIPNIGYSADHDLVACQHSLSALASSRDHSDVVRRRVLQDLMKKVFGEQNEDLRRLEKMQSNNEGDESTSLGYSSSEAPGSGALMTIPSHSQHSMRFQEQQLEHVTAHEDLRNLVHDAFSPDMGMSGWPPDEGFNFPRENFE